MKGAFKAMKALNWFVNAKDSYPKLDKSFSGYSFISIIPSVLW